MKIKKQHHGFLFWLAITSLVFGIILGVYFVIVVCTENNIDNVRELNTFVFQKIKTSPGDFISGTVGVLFILTATIFLFITFREQRKQFEFSGKQQKQASFETTYFNLLAMLDNVRVNVNKNIFQSYKGNLVEDIGHYYSLMKEYYKSYSKTSKVDNFHQISEELTLNSLSSEIDRAEGTISGFFDSFVNNQPCNVGYFFRYIYNTVNFAVNERSSEGDVEKYLNILQAQLSNEELTLIFYDALSSWGRDKNGEKKFKILLDNYQFLENIDVKYLLNRNHHLFYPKTKFKFLNRSELEKKL